MKKYILGLALLAFPLLSWAQVIPKMTFYNGAECPHCHEEKAWFPELRELYPDLEIESLEVWHNQANKQAFQNHMAQLGQEAKAVPTNVIEGEVIVGFKPDQILATLEKHYGPPTGAASTSPNITVVTEDDQEAKGSWWSRFMNWLKDLFS